MIEHVPLYPLAPLLFLAAVAVFALQMARHLRVFAVARGPANVGNEPGRLALAVQVRDRPGADVPRPGRGLACTPRSSGAS